MDLVVAAALVTSVWLKMIQEVEPLKTAVIFCVFCCNVCTVHYGQTGADFVFSMNETAFPVCKSGRVGGCLRTHNAETMFGP